MLIDFSKIEELSIPEFKGGKLNYIVRTIDVNDTKIMKGILKFGCSIGRHTHTNNSELIYILRGNLTIACDDNIEIASAGCIHLCPKGHTHEIINKDKEDAIFIAIVY